MNEIIERLSDYEIMTTFEDALRALSPVNEVGYFTSEVDRDDKGMKIVVRVAAMVDTAGEENFTKNEQLRVIAANFPEGPVEFVVEDAVTVSGMEAEVVYRPR